MAVIAVIMSYFVLQPLPSADHISSHPPTALERSRPAAADSIRQTPVTINEPAEFDPVLAATPASNVLRMPLRRKVPAQPPAPPVVHSEPYAPATDGRVPLLAELSDSYRSQIPALHVDVHVYDSRPARRFVMINRNKYREGQRTDDGPMVEQITHEGIVMRHQGRRFRLTL